MKANIRNVAIALGVLLVIILLDYLEHRSRWKQATEFIQQANTRSVESKIVRSSFELLNPFSWKSRIPVVVAARQSKDDGNVLILYADFTEEYRESNKVLVSADCAERKMRLVTQKSYDDFLNQSGYDLLGNKLPAWQEADYTAMQAVLIASPAEKIEQSLYFDIACEWDKFPTVKNSGGTA